MKRLHVTFIILITVFVTLAINVLFGGYLAARLATMPFMRNLNIVNPRSPIVINNKETIRVSDANDAVETAAAIRSKLSTLVYFEDDRIVQAGSALNWTSDGYFITSNKAFSVPGKTYAVMVQNGDIYAVNKIYADTASNLVLLETDAKGQSTVVTVEDKELRPAQKILFIANAVGVGSVSFLESYVRNISTDVSNLEFDSDRITRGIGVQPVTPLIPGTPAVTLAGRIAGIWDGSSVISSDAIRSFANDFFNDSKTVNRASYGFKYRLIRSAEARALKLAGAGALVTAVTESGAAATGGLQPDDIILAINDTEIKDDVLLETLLEPFNPSEPIRLSISRGGSTLTLVIISDQLK